MGLNLILSIPQNLLVWNKAVLLCFDDFLVAFPEPPKPPIANISGPALLLKEEAYESTDLTACRGVA